MSFSPNNSNTLECILLLDDDQINNVVSKRVIQTMNIAKNVICLDNGEAGINFIKSYYKENGSLPELILLDVNMPIMDGFEFLENFNTLNFPVQPLIVVLTTSCSSKDVERMKELGIKKYINKPLSKENVMKILEERLKGN